MTVMMKHLSDEQKERITEWVEENRQYQDGDLVTINYTSEDRKFAGWDYGGVPLRIKDVSWRGNDVTRVSKSGLHSIKEHDDEHRLIEIYDEDELHPKSGKTQYVTVTPVYEVAVTVDSDVSSNRRFSEAALIEWDEYDGELQFHPRDTETTTSLQEGEECRVCGFEAEKVSRTSFPAGSSGVVSCAVCGFIKERWAP